MSNKEIFEYLEKRHPKEEVKIFCRMQSEISGKLAIEFKKQHINEPCEHVYDTEWWLNKYYAL